MRTIVKWSKSAAVLASVLVLLVAYVFVDRVYAQPKAQVEHSLSQSQQEASKIKTQLEDIESENQHLENKVEVKDEKIEQLKKENARLKE